MKYIQGIIIRFTNGTVTVREDVTNNEIAMPYDNINKAGVFNHLHVNDYVGIFIDETGLAIDAYNLNNIEK